MIIIQEQNIHFRKM